jgi:uncharacterized membrane protein
VSEPERQEIERGREVERTIYFSDAVIAIAITLLALDLKLPQDLASGDLVRHLLGLWPRLYTFLISFWVIAAYWMAHHRIFNYIRAYDGGLLRINFLFLMWIVLMPFSSSLIGGYGDLQLPFVIYVVHLMLASLTLSWLGRHASQNPHLMEPGVDPHAVRRYGTHRMWLMLAVFALAICVSFFSVYTAEFTLVLLFVARPEILERLVSRKGT